jgi:toxin HigB-1
VRTFKRRWRNDRTGNFASDFEILPHFAAAPGSSPLDICTGTRYSFLLIRTFRHRGLKLLYRGDPSRVRADQARRLADVLSHLDTAIRVSDLDLPGYRLHALKGNLKGMWSVSISGNWRVVFRFVEGDAFDVDLTDYH